jgi:hypothetical protein
LQNIRDLFKSNDDLTLTHVKLLNLKKEHDSISEVKKRIAVKIEEIKDKTKSKK